MNSELPVSSSRIQSPEQTQSQAPPPRQISGTDHVSPQQVTPAQQEIFYDGREVYGGY